MNAIIEDKKASNQISTSINILNENDDEINNDIILNLKSTNKIKEKGIITKDEKQKNDKDDKITLEDLKNIITEPENKENNHEEKQEENKEIKKVEHKSNDEMLENELSSIKKQNLSKYLMENNQFKSTNIESEEEI